MSEDIIEDITEEALLEDQELVQDTAEEVTENQSYSDAIKSVLLGESKSSKKESEEDEESDEEEDEDEEDEMEEGYKKKTESEEDEESDEEEDEEEIEEGILDKVKDKLNPQKAKAQAELNKLGAMADKLEASLDQLQDKADEQDDAEDAQKILDKGDQMEKKLDAITAKMTEIRKKYNVKVTRESVEEAAKAPTATGDAKDAVIVKDAEAEAATTAADIKKSSKAGKQPKAAGDAKSVKATDETDSIKSVDAASKTKASAKTEDLDLLISAEANLTEDFKAKASTLFEAAVSQKIVAEKARLEEEYGQNLVEEVTEIRESLITKIDDYLNYVVESWVEENQIEVDSKLRTEIAEGFMDSLKNLFVESYIEVPAAKTDLFDKLESETATMKEELELAEAEALELSEKVEQLSREKILSEQTKDLASTQVEKMKALTEEVEFVSEEAFAEKVATIKSSVFSSSKSDDIVEETDSEIETIVEGESDINENVSNDMKKYLSALTRIKENNPNGK